ncbi:MAG TPA: tyrosine-protein phosphatase [Vicinamibacterales bacterium]|nr:tyrosine-protein phosphatase [Vicinamibacterales bacterium]
MHSIEKAVQVAAVCLALVLAVPGAARAEEAASSTAGAAMASHIGIFNFGKVSPTYYRGGELEGRDAADLAALGVKTVIDLRGSDYDPEEAPLVAAAGMSYVRMPMTTHTAPTPEQIATFLSIVNDPAKQPVYVHCVEGRHRTGVMTAVYRMTVDHWTADQAFEEMKHYKFGFDFLHAEFKQFVYAYHPAAPAGAPVQIASAATASATN